MPAGSKGVRDLTVRFLERWFKVISAKAFQGVSLIYPLPGVGGFMPETVDEEMLLRALRSIPEEDLLAWTRTVSEEKALGTASKITARLVGRPVSDSLVRCRERDAREGNNQMTLWDAPDYRIVQSVA